MSEEYIGDWECDSGKP